MTKDKEYFDIVLFSPPSRMINHYRPPVALLYIGGYLTRQGMRVKIIDVPLKEQVRNRDFFKNIDSLMDDIFNKMISEFSKIKTKIVGISCYTPEYFETLKLAAAIKKIDSSITIISGGVHPTFYPQDFLSAESDIDVCVLGEGELTTFDLCRSILNDGINNIGQIAGIAYFDDKSQKIVHTAKRPIAENLDEISFPDYSLVDMNYYSNANPYAIRGCFLRSTYLLATRGCPSQCIFCVAKQLREYNGCGRIRSAESLLQELKLLKSRYRIDSFYFMDDLFTVNKKNVEKFSSLLKTSNLNLLWGCSSKVSTLNEDLIKTMAEAGCIQIDFGVERGSDQALQLLKKGQTIETIKKIFYLSHKYGIRTLANMLVNLPSETEKDLEDIVALLNEISSEIVSVNIFTPYPGTEIYENSAYKFTKEEFANLSKDVTALIKTEPKKYKYALHNIDFSTWVPSMNRRFNKTIPNLRFYISLQYWKILLKSKHKLNYFRQFFLLIREFINQKF